MNYLREKIKAEAIGIGSMTSFHFGKPIKNYYDVQNADRETLKMSSVADNSRNLCAPTSSLLSIDPT
jgi:hypothetical protein